nr:YihY/virulence factor BrkB family protein [Flammeovirga sp. SubArs3]
MYGASLAYYTIISLPAGLNLIYTWMSTFFDEEQIKEDMIEEIALVSGDVVAKQLESMINSLDKLEIDSTVSTAISIGTLIFTSTLSFHTLKVALNKFWKVPHERQQLKHIILDRIISFVMLLVVGAVFLFLVLLDSSLSLLSEVIRDWLPIATLDLIQVTRQLSTLIMSFILFAGIYKYIPDVNIKWEDAFVGALVTTILFQGGQYAIRYYLSNSSAAVSWGAGSPLIIVMAWTFYSVQITFFGAEVTYVYSEEYGRGIQQKMEKNEEDDEL